MHKYSLFIILLFSFIFHQTVWSQNPIVGKTIYCENGVVVSAREEASFVGTQVLMNGGNAFDAAVAVHFVLSVTYPQAGNIGGGGFMVARLSSGEEVALDFREKAPALATTQMFLDENLEPVPDKSVLGHLACGVPGSVNGMETLHKKYGTKDWKELLQPSIIIAEQGFILTELDATELNKEKANIAKLNPSHKYLYKKDLFKAGDTIQQPDLARTLRLIALKGAKEFYEGEIAHLIVKEMKRGKGLIDFEDLKNYQSVWRTPLSMNYSGYKVVTMPPPSSGGIALLQMLYMLQKLGIKKYPLLSPSFISLVTEVERLAYADRSQYLGDPDFIQIPVQDLLSTQYLKKRMKSLKPLKKRSSSDVKPGIVITESEQTTHYSIVDQWGNAVAITTTINSKFGSRVFVDKAGFLLNNEMDDFSVKPGTPNQFGLTGNQANEIQPGKRMLSSMTPTLVVKNNEVVLVTGAPGGATIITSVLQNILHTLFYHLDLDVALATPRFHHQWLPDVVYMEDSAKWENSTLSELKAAGYIIKFRDPIGRVDAILKTKKGWCGSGDPRGDDFAAGY